MSNPCQAASFLRTLLLSADLSVPVSLLFSAGDDVYALWGAKLNPENVTFRRNVAVNPGILRPNWYGNCVATYVSAERSGPAQCLASDCVWAVACRRRCLPSDPA